MLRKPYKLVAAVVVLSSAALVMAGDPHPVSGPPQVQPAMTLQPVTNNDPDLILAIVTQDNCPACTLELDKFQAMASRGELPYTTRMEVNIDRYPTLGNALLQGAPVRVTPTTVLLKGVWRHCGSADEATVRQKVEEAIAGKR